ncbi:MAG: NADH-quinone oxidoreductase subunit NuoH [Gemmataceae bacterium]|nr:NADH-quinone oxidoreductase subunit NuoH [Gemmataceae bacterium]MDW8267340.1 NADH-quinone oxidoreductase subunit NuoH [Gemmataceae bacterium]
MTAGQLLTTLVTIVVVVSALQGACAYLILLERKIAAYVQDRIGPNRVGPRGLLQPIADGLKFLFKEEVIPDHVDKLFFLLAPAVAVSTALLAFAVVPFGPTSVEQPPAGYQFVIAPRVDIGILFVFAVSSLAVYGIVLGGWSANNKYSFLGALRASAQVISYEIPLGLSVLGVVLVSRSLNLERIIAHQVEHGWNILFQPLAFLIFLIAVFAECNRLPFDLPEAEQELVGGYHTEYSGMKFAMFFLGEYTHMITTSLLVTALFLGGWHLPGLGAVTGLVGVLLKLIVTMLKLFGCIVFFMLIRWTIPRFRFDQLMALAWRGLVPLALLHLLAVMVVLEWQLPRWLLLPMSLLLVAGAAGSAARASAAPRPALTAGRG